MFHSKPPAYYASLYKKHNFTGGHVIKLGPGNDEAARKALAAWPNMLQIGGGINLSNASTWINDHAAAKVIVTSAIFPKNNYDEDTMRRLSELVGKGKLVVDLSCRKRGLAWIVATDKWQTLTDTKITEKTLSHFAEYCSEFLIHAADVEGLCKGIDEDLVLVLGKWSKINCTYAGGGRDIADLELVKTLSGGNVDLTFGSALDIFGGTGVKLDDCVKWNSEESQDRP